VEIARNPAARIRDISPVVGLTERSVQAIAADLEAAGAEAAAFQGEFSSGHVFVESCSAIRFLLPEIGWVAWEVEER
jgi:hypothetical protein